MPRFYVYGAPQEVPQHPLLCSDPLKKNLQISPDTSLRSTSPHDIIADNKGAISSWSRWLMLPMITVAVAAVLSWTSMHHHQEFSSVEAQKFAILVRENKNLRDQIKKLSEVVVESSGEEKIVRIEVNSDGKIIFHAEGDAPAIDIDRVIELRTKDGKTFKFQ